MPKRDNSDFEEENITDELLMRNNEMQDFVFRGKESVPVSVARGRIDKFEHNKNNLFNHLGIVLVWLFLITVFALYIFKR